ncbi:MAG: helix-turn-helix domain-containing protein [Thermomicrobiales bacterium]
MLAFGNASEESFGGSRPEPGRSSRTTSSESNSRNGHNERWLSINAACEILGVDKSTLRRWSDRGRIPVFRTPGGHRRYSEADLQAFLSGELGQQRRVSRRELAALTREEFQRFSPQNAVEHALAPIRSEGWTEELRHVCDRMFDLSVRYASGRGDADRLLAEAHELAREYGRCTAGAGLVSSQAVETFLRFRRPLLDGLCRYVEEKNLPVRRSCRMIGKLNAYLDVVLTSVVESHEAHSAQ